MGSHKTISASISIGADIIGLFDMLPKTGQTITYQNFDDGYYEKGAPLWGPHFTDKGNGTILDNATGLYWVKDPINDIGAPFNATMNWSNAIINCEALNFAGKNDWRLPNIKELNTLPDYSRWDPAMDPVFFPNAMDANHWSSTTYALNPILAPIVNFYAGTIYFLNKTTLCWVRPVRG